MTLPAHVKYIILSILFVIASVNFTRTALEIIQNSKRLDDVSHEVTDLEEKKTNLEESVAYKKTDEYVEEKARNDLSLIRPGEKVYVIPQELKDVDLESTVLGQKSWRNTEDADTNKTNIQKWIDLFIR